MTGVCNFFIIKLVRAAVEKQRGMIGGRMDKKKEQDNNSLTIMLVVVSTFSIVIYAPRSIAQIYYNFQEWTLLNGAVDRLLECIGILNHSVNFLFYCMGGKTFREDFLRIITCQRCEDD
jgi:hypothetical protein